MLLNLGGTQPELGLKKLSQESIFPGLFSKEKPLTRSQDYWAGYAFIKYLDQSWGGENALARILSDLKGDQPSSTPLLNQIAQSIHNLMQETNPSNPWIEKATRNGLLRFFAAALTIHTPKTLALDFPNWSGLESAPLLPQMLLPTQWLAIKQTSQVQNALSQTRSDGLEIYEIRTGFQGTRILPYSGENDFDFNTTLLILNTGPKAVEFNQAKKP
jgi:hypothetical protein